MTAQPAQHPAPKPKGGDSTLQHALSFDIEDWFHMVEIDAVADVDSWGTLPSIVVKRTHWIIDKVAESGHGATFFMLGWVAERYPEIAQHARDNGFEIATHSYWHRKVYELSPQEFRDDIKRSIDVLENQTGQRILGFRAPSFSITPGTEWAFDILLELGLTYDASLFPASRGHGGYPCPQEAHLITTPAGATIPELPMSIDRIGPAAIPFSGGGYMRLLPKRWIERSFRRFENRQTPVVIYLHPRDFETNTPRVPMPLRRRFKCYVGISSTAGKLDRLLKRHSFTSCRQVLAAAGFQT